MSQFKDWFEHKLVVAPFPKSEDFDTIHKGTQIVINVSDEYYFDIHQEIQNIGIMYFWFPMNERKRDIGLNAIFAGCSVLNEAEYHNKKVLLHCHSGRNRSRMVQAAYYYLRTGEHLEQKREHSKHFNRLYAASYRGYIPPMAELEQFLNKIKEGLETYPKYKGGMLDWAKKETINNF